MSYINAFLLCGFICFLAQILLDNTKLTPGHITALFVVVGALLSFLGIYDTMKEFSLVGSSLPITSFGNALYKAAIEGYEMNGFIGMLSNLFTTTGAGIGGAIYFGFIIALFSKVKD